MKRLLTTVLPMILAGLVLTACAPPAGPVPPNPTVATPAGGRGPVAPAPASDEMITDLAAVASVEAFILESFPVQVNAIARGALPDGCTTIDEAMQERDGNVFTVTLTTARPADAMCTQAIVPFEEVIPLDVLGLPAGSYTVTVNGVSDTFELAVDNVALDEAAAKLPASCAPAGPEQLSYVNTAYGYCLLYPAGFELSSGEPDLVLFTGPSRGDGPEPLQASLLLAVVEGAVTMPVGAVVDQLVSEFSGLAISRTAATWSDEPVEIVENLPGRTATRQAFIVHDGNLYRLIFAPLDPDFAAAASDLEALWELVSGSFAFMPE